MAFKGKSRRPTLGSVLIPTVRRCSRCAGCDYDLAVGDLSLQVQVHPSGCGLSFGHHCLPNSRQIETSQYYPLRWLGRVHSYLPFVTWRTLVGGNSSTLAGPKRCAGLRFHPGHLQQYCVGQPMGGCWQVLGRDGTARGWTRVNLRFVSARVRG